ncbi:MAG: hypothetical protein HeimC3_19890 [Candidatus Heimdallarchaeota archaeon LC_3]|nr:MAG: hypothetical protein HeimC3_19890 [Candidatus Heimdallarchaeota archaeon LC_3]
MINMQVTVKKQRENKNIEDSSTLNSEEGPTTNSEEQELKEKVVKEEKEEIKDNKQKKEKGKPIKVDIDTNDKPLEELKEKVVKEEKEEIKEDQQKKERRKSIKVDIDVTDKPLEELKQLIKVREIERTKVLDSLREINQQREQVKEKRNDYNQESAESFAKVSELKEKRDGTNKEIRELKTTRGSVLAELKDLSQREREIIQQFQSQDDNKKINKKDARSIQNHIEKLEWQLQTVPNLTLIEQRALMDRIDELSSKLGEVEVSEAAQRELKEIRRRKGNLKGFLDDSWKQLSELVSASQGRHNRLSELYDTGKKSKYEADKNHELFIKKVEEARKYRNRLRVLKAELDVVYPAMKKLQEKKRKSDQSLRTERTIEIKEEKRTEIKRKLSTKKGLSIEEMKFMLENQMINLESNKGKKKRSKK